MIFLKNVSQKSELRIGNMKTTVSLPSVFLFLRGISPSLPVLLWCGAAFRSGLVLPSPPSFLESAPFLSSFVWMVVLMRVMTRTQKEIKYERISTRREERKSTTQRRERKAAPPNEGADQGAPPNKDERSQQHHPKSPKRKQHHKLWCISKELGVGKYETAQKSREKATISAPEGFKREETGLNAKELRQAEKGLGYKSGERSQRQKKLRNTRERTEGGEQQGLSPSPNMSRDNIDEILLEDVTWL